MEKINILVIGSGGREHAIVRALNKSESKNKIFCSPGNSGIAKLTECINLVLKNFDAVIDFCKKNEIDLVVIGPEQPLADGLSDALRKENINVFGPSKFAAQLETSKSFAKDFMKKYQIPTAKYSSFAQNEFENAKKYIEEMSVPIVIKADGLAAGKGVEIANSKTDAINIVKKFLEGAFGEASQKIVIEEFMQGEEASVFAICDGNDFVVLAPAQDHKRIGDNDTGKNTGGMGSYSPVSIVAQNVLNKVCEQIIKPTLAGMKSEGNPFVGCLYAGLMLENGNPLVVEFNVRFGDPETQAVLSIFKGDFAKLLYSAAIESIDKAAYSEDLSQVACCVILASNGYPEKFETGFEITGNAYCDNADIIVYHSGAKIIDDKLVTSGGRVLGITAIGNNINEAITKAYKFADEINFENKYYRTDIGKKELHSRCGCENTYQIL